MILQPRREIIRPPAGVVMPPRRAMSYISGGAIQKRNYNLIIGATSQDEVPFDNVILLVQGGALASTTMKDWSIYGPGNPAFGTSSWSSAVQVFGQNTILGVQNSNNNFGFTSTNNGSRFARTLTDETTIQIWTQFHTLLNFSPSGIIFEWFSPSGAYFRINYKGSGVALRLQIRVGTGIPQDLFTPVQDTLYYIQVGMIGSNLYVEVDGVELFTFGAMPSSSGAGTYTVALAGFTGGTAGPMEYYASPCRMVKGVTVPRGVIPSGPWPTS